MSEKFSATLRIGDLSDYIAPSQACVVSLNANSTRLDKLEDRVKVVTARKAVQTEPVKISLKDCLACSGCITSAETVLLEKQSCDEFISNISNGKAVIVSLSPQSRASLAVHFGLTPLQVFRKLTTFLKSLGVKAVFDTSCSRDLSLIESCNEFISRYKQRNSTDSEKTNSVLPMIASACPGWICYAEKTHGSHILPYISSVKSPQQTIGAIIKHHVCRKLGLRLEEIYHVTVMPCYDKKLEAARDDFVFRYESDDENRKNADLYITEVDSVLTSGEILDLLRLKSVDFQALEESPLDRMLTNVTEDGHLFGVNGSSGGYADTIFRYAAKEIFGKSIKGPLDFKTIRRKSDSKTIKKKSDSKTIKENSDFREVSLEIEGETVLKFAICYGFRYIQNIASKIKNGKCEYQFVEVMACPSGCLNGGGQIKPKSGQSGDDLIQILETTYTETVLAADPFENPVVKKLYEEWLGHPGSEKAKMHLHTQYHPVLKSVTSQLQDW
jgi:iron only hydrogenase large subunit-like protein